MDESSSSSFLQDAMDKLWFHRNILLFEPTGLSLRSTTEIAPTSTCTTPSTSPTERSNQSKSAAETKNRQPSPKRLSVVIGQPLFQLRPPPRTSIRSHTPSPSINAAPPPEKQRRVPEKIRSYRSLSELENFVFHREKLSPQMMSMQRLQENGDGGEEKRAEDEKRVRRPYLSDAWLMNRSNSRLLDLQILPKLQEGVDMKKHLRFWAREVASLIHEGS